MNKIVNINKLLKSGCKILKIDLEEDLVVLFEKYISILITWNKIYNLTSIIQPSEIVTKHILDSLSISPWLENRSRRVLDLGSGAGFPGIPLAIINKHMNIILIDNNIKRIRFLNYLLLELQLNNITVIYNCIEKYNKENIKFDTIVTRAFSNLLNIINVSRKICTNDSQILAMKGNLPTDEISRIYENNINCTIDTYPLLVPGLKANRHLVKISNLH